MAFYFVCPGEASVSGTTVQCSQAITTVDGSSYAADPETRQKFIDLGLSALATLLVLWLIKKAIDI